MEIDLRTMPASVDQDQVASGDDPILGYVCRAGASYPSHTGHPQLEDASP
jgi:hypothetical protein